MPCILNIETATTACSVVVAVGNEIVFEKENTEGLSHARLLGAFVSEALADIRAKGLRLDAISVSCGPGSYTGLRIGVSEAKGLCYGLEIPLIAVKSLEIMAKRVMDTISVESGSLLCPMIDARRMEVYAAIYDSSLHPVREISADIVDSGSYEEYLSKGSVLFFGDGSGKCASVINSPNASFIEGVYPSARYMAPLSVEAFEQSRFVDTASFEPFYLKDFIATVPKNHLLQ
jgi:tRNA threonylcarbamoyladenosine biosynthesis protein TsaB